MIGVIRALPGSEIAWVANGQGQRAAAYAARHGIPSSTADLDEMLEDPEVDAVYISSMNEKHRAQALAATAAGKHVLCEKPLAMTVADAREMVASAEAAGRVFATNHHLRNAATHLAIRETIAGGQIGRVLSARIHPAVFLPPHLQGWRINDASAGGGVIADITVHDADTVRFVLGEDPEAVIAMAGQSGIEQGVERGDNPAMIGSGPTEREGSTPADALALLGRWKIDPPPSRPAGALASLRRRACRRPSPGQDRDRRHRRARPVPRRGSRSGEGGRLRGPPARRRFRRRGPGRGPRHDSLGSRRP